MGEKPLAKMTATELREVAKELPDITGAHGMNKSELIAAIQEAKGIASEGPQKDTAYVRNLKKQIKTLKQEKEQAKQSGNADAAQRLRRRVSRLKKKTRRAAA